MNSFSRWLRSKQGMTIIGIVVILALVVGIIGTQTDLFGAAGGKKKTPAAPTPTGTAGAPVVVVTEAPPPVYSAPKDGYTCLPTCVENDSKMLALVGESTSSFSGSTVYLWIAVPASSSTFELGIFDGDSGKDNAGADSWSNGNWDLLNSEVTYTLLADPVMNGTGTVVLGTWRGNADNMPNNAWWSQTLSNVPEAEGPSGHYYYLLKVERAAGKGVSNFKVRTTGYLSGGQGDMVGTSMGIASAMITMNDLRILYPEFAGDYNNPGPSTYSGEWTFYFYVPADTKTVEFWDGDMDRGTSQDIDGDTDDPNSEGIPPFATGFAVAERAGGKGSPQDDAGSPLYRRSPAVVYDIIDPVGAPIYTNSDPSGTEEWEKFSMSSDPASNADLVVPEIKPGLYTVHVKGLDVQNTVWFFANQQLCDASEGCGPEVYTEAFCPRTIGYWKNNVKKVLIEGRTNGVQETPDSIHKALDFIAKESTLYRSGLNVAQPQPIASVVRLTDQEANAIMQKDAGNSMLDRALQQNLATWLNMASGKIGPNTRVVINTPNGTFDGTLMDALRTAEAIILANDSAQMGYAKDIADMINNGAVDIDPESNVDDAGTVTCDNPAIPDDKQPPKHEDLPKAPVPEEPTTTLPEPPQDTATCTGRENKYQVENPTNNPFYSIKFNYVSGTEIKNGDSDIFSYTIPQAAAASMTTMQVEAKAATDQAIFEMTCDFTSPLACDPVGDPERYKVQFLGAKDNGDGTVTLTFQVWVYANHGLSHASFGLPEGVVATSSGEYTAKVCTP